MELTCDKQDSYPLPICALYLKNEIALNEHECEDTDKKPVVHRYLKTLQHLVCISDCKAIRESLELAQRAYAIMDSELWKHVVGLLIKEIEHEYPWSSHMLCNIYPHSAGVCS